MSILIGSVASAANIFSGFAAEAGFLLFVADLITSSFVSVSLSSDPVELLF